MHFRRFSFANPRTRGAVALLALVAICASVVPIPLGVIYRETKDLSQPFPCQHCACGCKNAEQCWTNCCCYSPAEKLDWAMKNRVTPPSYAVKGINEKTSSVATRKCANCKAVEQTVTKSSTSSADTCMIESEDRAIACCEVLHWSNF